jgi:hypothetical protein
LIIDRREAILARLLEVAETAARTIDTCFEARRNEPDLPDTAKWVVILDGDELAEESDPDGRSPFTTPRRIVMMPEVQFRLISSSENAGTSLNECRRVLLPAVTQDSTLLSLCTGKTKIRYRGATTVIERGRKLDGAIAFGFNFHYVLKMDELFETVTV